VQQTLPKSIILRGYQSFSRIISNGKSIHGTLVSAYVLIRTDGPAGVQIGFTASKKRVRLAVLRNRLKRLMRESARKTIHEINEAALRKQIGIEVVLSYNGKSAADVRRLALRDIEPEWAAVHRRIMEMI
jgi:ribonuclease P protein component